MNAFLARPNMGALGSALAGLVPHIGFLWPTFLWGLLLVPLMAAIYVLLLRRRKKGALNYANLTLVRRAIGVTGWRRHVPPVLMLGALTILIIAIARPTAEVSLPSTRATVMLAMDVSGSMRAADVNPSRIEAAQAAAKQYVKDQPKDVLIGIVAFAATAFLVQNPTTDRTSLNAAIDRFELQRGTAVGSGILVSLSTLFPQDDFPISNFNGGGFGRGNGGAGFGGGNNDYGRRTRKSMSRSSPAPTRMRSSFCSPTAPPMRAMIRSRRRGSPRNMASRSIPWASARPGAILSALAVSRCAPSSMKMR